MHVPVGDVCFVSLSGRRLPLQTTPIQQHILSFLKHFNRLIDMNRQAMELEIGCIARRMLCCVELFQRGYNVPIMDDASVHRQY